MILKYGYATNKYQTPGRFCTIHLVLKPPISSRFSSWSEFLILGHENFFTTMGYLTGSE